MAVVIDGTSGITLPSGSAAVGTTDTQTITNKTIGTGYAGSTLTLSTAQNTTSGTSIDFTGIPPWVNRITIMFNGVSTVGTSILVIQLGTSGGFQTTGYNGTGGSLVSTGTATNVVTSVANTIGFDLSNTSTRTAGDTIYGTAVLTRLTGNTFILNSYTSNALSSMGIAGGGVTITGTVDRLRLTTLSGTDTFDAGSVNIMWE